MGAIFGHWDQMVARVAQSEVERDLVAEAEAQLEEDELIPLDYFDMGDDDLAYDLS